MDGRNIRVEVLVLVLVYFCSVRRQNFKKSVRLFICTCNILDLMIGQDDNQLAYKTSPQFVVGARKEARTVWMKAIKIHLHEKEKNSKNCSKLQFGFGSLPFSLICF